jgi:hypothetical protein
LCRASRGIAKSTLAWFPKKYIFSWVIPFQIPGNGNRALVFVIVFLVTHKNQAKAAWLGFSIPPGLSIGFGAFKWKAKFPVAVPSQKPKFPPGLKSWALGY